MIQEHDNDNDHDHDTHNDIDSASPRSFIHAREFFMKLGIFCENHDDDNEATLDYLKGVVSYILATPSYQHANLHNRSSTTIKTTLIS
jgi:hypothetical protein